MDLRLLVEASAASSGAASGFAGAIFAARIGGPCQCCGLGRQTQWTDGAASGAVVESSSAAIGGWLSALIWHRRAFPAAVAGGR